MSHKRSEVATSLRRSAQNGGSEQTSQLVLKFGRRCRVVFSPMQARICVLLSLRPMSAEAVALHNGTVRQIDEIKAELARMICSGIVQSIRQANGVGDSVTLYELREVIR